MHVKIKGKHGKNICAFLPSNGIQLILARRHSDSDIQLAWLLSHNIDFIWFTHAILVWKFLPPELIIGGWLVGNFNLQCQDSLSYGILYYSSVCHNMETSNSNTAISSLLWWWCCLLTPPFQLIMWRCTMSDKSRSDSAQLHFSQPYPSKPKSW